MTQRHATSYLAHKNQRADVEMTAVFTLEKYATHYNTFDDLEEIAFIPPQDEDGVRAMNIARLTRTLLMLLCALY